MSSGDDLTFAMDRAAIWKAGLQLLKDSGTEFNPGDVTELAEFLAGDNIPFPMTLSTETDDSDEESADSGTEGS